MFKRISSVFFICLLLCVMGFGAVQTTAAPLINATDCELLQCHVACLGYPGSAGCLANHNPCYCDDLCTEINCITYCGLPAACE